MERDSILSRLQQCIRELVADEVRQQLGDNQSGGRSSESMTADEVAEFLGLDRKTVYDYANRGELPCQKLGKRTLFSRAEIVRWLRGESALSQKGS